MTRSDTVRRVKSYSALSGYVFQYYFYEVEKTRRGLSAGTDYVYMVSADRKTAFPVRIFIRADAVEQWNRAAGRALSGTEEYAAAKMRLFQAFDEAVSAESLPHELQVDHASLGALLQSLDI